MNHATITLEGEPTLDDFARVTEAAGRGCYCTDAQRETKGRPMAMLFAAPQGTEQVTCKPCAARYVLNCLATLSEVL